jgi:hypothetical protein
MLNEVQEYSTAGKLVPTVLEGLNGKNGSREENNKTSNSSSMTWLKYATVGALTLSVGVAVYKRYIQKQ